MSWAIQTFLKHFNRGAAIPPSPKELGFLAVKWMKVDIPRRGRPRIKIHSWDTWDVSYTLAPIILPILKAIKKDKNGIPGAVIWEMYPERTDHSKIELEASEQKWHEILDKMIWSMEHIANPNLSPEISRLKGQTRKQREKRHHEQLFENALRTPEEEELSQKWRTEYFEYEKKKQEGCELFGKYFQNLWT